MKKNDYLNSPGVSGLTSWIAENFENEKTGIKWRSRKSGDELLFRSLKDAIDRYHWPFRTFHPKRKNEVLEGRSLNENIGALEILSKEIKLSLKSDDQDRVRSCCKAIFSWGGVRNGNVLWADGQKNIVNFIHSQKETLESDNDQPKGIGRYTSGMSKVYSLIIDDFAIYDSRVAAALALYAKRYELDNGPLPKEIIFPLAPPKESIKNDNPKIRTIDGFPRLRTGANYAKWNIRANWLLQDLTKKIAKNGIDVRSLESGLFMIGYDISKGLLMKNTEKDKMAKSENQEFTSETLGGKNKRIRFSSFIQGEEVAFKSESNQPIPPLKLGAIVKIASEFKARHQEGEEWVKLDNAVNNLESSKGLGGILYSLPEKLRSGDKNRFAQCASYYGPMLCDNGILQWNGKNRGIAFRLEPQFMTGNHEAEIKKHLDALQNQEDGS